jgi:hypothetical protein
MQMGGYARNGTAEVDVDSVVYGTVNTGPAACPAARVVSEAPIRKVGALGRRAGCLPQELTGRRAGRGWARWVGVGGGGPPLTCCLVNRLRLLLAVLLGALPPGGPHRRRLHRVPRRVCFPSVLRHADRWRGLGPGQRRERLAAAVWGRTVHVPQHHLRGQREPHSGQPGTGLW